MINIHLSVILNLTHREINDKYEKDVFCDYRDFVSSNDREFTHAGSPIKTSLIICDEVRQNLVI
jgi:hypothetical protein